jgi:hypothetical protein
MDKAEALKLICADPAKINNFWICDDDGDVGNFSNEVIKAKVQAKDFGFFENDYVRFLARVDAMGLGFIKGEDKTYESDIDFELIQKVCEVVQEMPQDKKKNMYDNLHAYRVYFELP